MQVTTCTPGRKTYQKLITLLVVFEPVGGGQGVYVLIENKSLGFISELMGKK